MNILGHDNGTGGPPLADADIVAAARGRDREAAAELLIAAHAPALGRTCMALLGSQSDAEAALRETLGDALDGVGSFRGGGSLRVWLLGIARRRCARKLEARRRQREPSQPLTAPDPPLSDEQALAQRARRLLTEVRPTEREALVLHFAGELSFHEVGEACGIDEAAARQRVSRGLSRLRGLLGEDEA